MADKYVQMHPLNETKTALDETVNVYPLIGPNSFKNFNPENATEPNVFKPQEKLVSGENIKDLAFSEKVPAASLLGRGILNLPLLDLLYPVGSIYMCAEDNFNGKCPIEELLGGIWVRIKDKFMYAAGDNDKLGATGGSKDAVVVSHAHEMTEGGSHTHTINGIEGSVKMLRTWNDKGNMPLYDAQGSIELNQVEAPSTSITADSCTLNFNSSRKAANEIKIRNDATATSAGNHSHSILAEGVSGTGKNMPPYLVVYMWKRVEDVESEE